MRRDALLRCFGGLFLFVLSALTAFGADSRVLAFPGAEGYGRFATGGRGGEVLRVTTLADSGPGSLREAIETEGPRTIVFAIGGVIALETPLRVEHGDLTIAGESAPGEGITLTRRGLVVLNAENVILRFLRIRLGDGFARDSGREAFSEDAFECRYSKNIIVDHCSFAWGIDETATMYRNQDTTFQWSFISEALNDSFHSKGSHGFGGIWGGLRASFHHNLIAHHRSRLPRLQGARSGNHEEWGDDLVDFRNNVIYNWGDNNIYGGEPHSSGFQSRYNIVANAFRAGPATRPNRAEQFMRPDTNRDGLLSRYFVAENWMHGADAINADNALGVSLRSDAKAQDWLVKEPFVLAPVRTQSAQEALAAVLAFGGATFPRRDGIDARHVAETRSGEARYGQGGLIDSQLEVGGYPKLPTVAGPPDRDGDGLPDAWEIPHGLDPDDATDSRQLDPATGYTHLELYHHALVAGRYTATPETPSRN